MSPIQEAKTIPGVLKPSPDAPRKPRKGFSLFMRPLDLDAGYVVCICMHACVLLCALLGRSSKTFLRSLKKIYHPQTAQNPCCKPFLEDTACSEPIPHDTTHRLSNCKIQTVKWLLFPSPWATAKGAVATDICTQPEASHNIPPYPSE